MQNNPIGLGLCEAPTFEHRRVIVAGRPATKVVLDDVVLVCEFGSKPLMLLGVQRYWFAEYPNLFRGLAQPGALECLLQAADSPPIKAPDGRRGLTSGVRCTSARRTPVGAASEALTARGSSPAPHTHTQAGRRVPRSTCCGLFVERLIRRYDLPTVTIALRAIVESQGNECELIADLIGAVCDVVRTHPRWVNGSCAGRAVPGALDRRVASPRWLRASSRTNA